MLRRRPERRRAEKSREMIKGIIEVAHGHGADMIVNPCPVCQMNVEVYQNEINDTDDIKMPVVYYSILSAVAYGCSPKKQHRMAGDSGKETEYLYGEGDHANTGQSKGPEM